MKRIIIFRIIFYSIACFALLFLTYSFGTVSGYFRGVLLTQASFTENYTNTTMKNLELINTSRSDSLKNSLEAQLDLGLIILLGRQEVRSPWLVRAQYTTNDEQIRTDVISTLERGAIYRLKEKGQLIEPESQYYQDLVQFVPVGSATIDD